MNGMLAVLLCLSGLEGIPDAAPQARLGGQLYVALPEGGVAIYDIADPQQPKRLRVELPQVRASALIPMDGYLGVVELRRELHLLALDGAAARPSSAMEASGDQVPVQRGAPPVLRGKVEAVQRGRAMLLMEAQGLQIKDRVAVLSQRTVERPSLSDGQLRSVVSNEVVAVLEIEAVEGLKAMALLGRGDTAEPGDVVRVTAEPQSQNLWTPRRAPFQWQLGFRLKPFLGVEAFSAGAATKPFGLMLDAYATWYARSIPLALTVAASPVGVGIGGGDEHYPSVFSALIHYATDYFEIGLGLGAMLGNRGPCVQTGLAAVASCEVNRGLTINQSLRLGAMDGLNFTWRSSVLSRPQQFVFGSGSGEVAIPLTQRLSLLGGGGAGENGWATGEFGVRTYVGGAGAKGTLLISALLGYAGIFDGPSGERVGGPSVSFGMEWRQ